MNADWLILHAGALGDLALMLQLALLLPDVDAASTLWVVSRTNPGDLSSCRPSVRRISLEGIGLHWLHADGDDPPPERLRELIAGRRVLNALSDAESAVHRRLVGLGARGVFSFDSRPDAQSSAHITMQWQSRLEGQGLLTGKRLQEHRGGAHLLVPNELRERGHLTGLQEPERTSRATAGAGPGRHPRLREDAGRDARLCEDKARSAQLREDKGRSARLGEDASRTAFPVPEGRVKVAQGASPGTAADPKTRSPNGAIEVRPILIHPGSGGRAKCWPLACFIDVARRLRESGELVCFVVGPVELERWPVDDLNAIRAEFPVFESPAPNDLLCLLAGARVLIANDAGPAHLAALLGTPTVTIFGPTSPAVWHPLGPAARCLYGDSDSYPDDWGISLTRVVEAAGL